LKILRIAEVVERTGLSRPTIWRRERAGLFPRRRSLGGNAVGWLEHEIQEWIQGLPPAGESSRAGKPRQSKN
jgi:prophage regulatory protein